MADPDFMKQILWSEPVTVKQLVLNAPVSASPVNGVVATKDIRLKDIPNKPGLYFFTRSEQPFSVANALYAGKSDAVKAHLRKRISKYVCRFRKSITSIKRTHKGCELMNEYYRNNQTQMYVRWAVVVVAREVEGFYHEVYGPRFNSRFETPIEEYAEYIDPFYLGLSDQMPDGVEAG